MKKLVVALTVLCLVFTSISAVQAQSNGETVRINLDFQYGRTVYVSAGDYIVLTHGWGACTRGLVQMYRTAVHTELGINGEIVSVADGKDQFWGSIYKMSGLSWLQYCVAGNQQYGWIAQWNYPLGTLPPGEYEVYYKYWLDHRVIDGTDNDGDGRLESWNGLLLETTFTIVVE